MPTFKRRDICVDGLNIYVAIAMVTLAKNSLGRLSDVALCSRSVGTETPAIPRISKIMGAFDLEQVPGRNQP
jgi:hypothetical protein